MAHVIHTEKYVGMVGRKPSGKRPYKVVITPAKKPRTPPLRVILHRDQNWSKVVKEARDAMKEFHQRDVAAEVLPW